jgi:histidinol-phosphate aminotransferase
MYDVYSKLYQADLKTVNYDEDLTWSVDDMIEKINDKTSLIIIANPNNPIGDYKNPLELDGLFKITNKLNIPVLLDEAYIEFVPDTYPSFERIFDVYNNVIICRTMSKAYGAAGIRLGYIMANSETMRLIEKWRLMHEVTGPTIKFGLFLLDNIKVVKDYVEKTNKEKKVLYDLFSEKFDVINSHCNWLHINDKDDNKFICSVLDKYNEVTYKAGAVIPFDNRKNWLRLTVGPQLSETKFIGEILK